MSLPRLILIGASGHGRVVLDAVRRAGCYEPIGWADTAIPEGTEVARLRVLGRTADLPRLAAEHRADAYFLAISDNVVRSKVAQTLRESCPGLEFARVIHPAATVAEDVVMGPGCLVLAGAVINANCRVGTGCIVNTRASLDHDGLMKDWSCLLPGVCTGGNVAIGEYACICIGATLAHKVEIGDHTVVGAGAVVLANQPAHSLVFGVPARVARARQPGERHF